MAEIKTINPNTARGLVDIKSFQLCIIAARFNSAIVDLLIEGAQKEATAQGISPNNMALIRVPGAFELGYAARLVINQRQPHAVVALGSVIRGETSHYDYVCAESARGIQDAAIDTGTPVIFGVLTTENTEQAIRRANPNQRNKGGQAVKDAIDMVALRLALAL